MSDPLDDREDEIAEVARKRIVETLDREGELEQLGAILKAESARDFLWRVLVQCNVYSEGYDRNFGDMARNSGKRAIGLWLLAEICEADPNAEMLMRQKSVLLAHEQARSQRTKRLARST